VKWPYTVVKGCSKLRVMQKEATNRDDERPTPTNRLTEASRETRRLGQRHTVKEAAEVLGTTVDAVRGRIRRGTLDSVKLDGVVYVQLDPTNREQHSDHSEPDDGYGRQQTGDQAGLAADQSELVGELRGQIDWLRREVERKDTNSMSINQRIPELEAPREPRDAPETATEGTPGTEPPASDMGEPRRSSWWRRFFGFK
jgi:hypothetical protein